MSLLKLIRFEKTSTLIQIDNLYKIQAYRVFGIIIYIYIYIYHDILYVSYVCTQL
jgi:hypothetical protein